jgi:hypothetical protein
MWPPPTSGAWTTRGRPTARRIAALLKRERRSAGEAVVNAKRVYRLMKNEEARSAARPPYRAQAAA